MLQLSKTELEMIQVACNAAALVSSVNDHPAQEREFLDIAAHCKELSEADAPCQITWVAEDIRRRFKMRTGTMLKTVILLGTSLRLEKGQRVLLVESTNQPDKTRFFASPIDEDWDDSILLDHGDWELDKGDFCSHNAMRERLDDAHAWECAECGYVYGKE